MIATWANVITAIRVGIFVCFIAFVHEERLPLATVFFVLAWGLDAIDGFVARALAQASSVGSLFDKAVDRIVLAAGALTVLAYGVVPGIVVLLFAKEWISILLFLWRRQKRNVFDFGKPGKLATLLEGLGLIWLMLGWPYAGLVVLIVATIGTVVGLRQVLWAARRPVDNSHH